MSSWLQEERLYSRGSRGMLSKSRKLSILEKETNNSNDKGMTLANLKDKLIRRALMKAASIKAVEGVITWPVRTNVNTAINTATILEVNRELSIVDRRAFFFSRMEISLLKDRGYKRTNKSGSQTFWSYLGSFMCSNYLADDKSLVLELIIDRFFFNRL